MRCSSSVWRDVYKRQLHGIVGILHLLLALGHDLLPQTDGFLALLAVDLLLLLAAVAFERHDAEAQQHHQDGQDDQVEPGKLVFANDDLRIQLHGAIEHCRTDADDGKEDDENSCLLYTSRCV